MNALKNIVLKKKTISNKYVTDIIYEKCIFSELVVHDISFENVSFIECKFNHLFVEAFDAKNILIKNSEISSLSLRGERKITQKKLFKKVRANQITDLSIYDSEIVELTLGGNLNLNNCRFPTGSNYHHVKNPHSVYSDCLVHVTKYWEGEKRRIGMIELENFYLSKGVDKQNEDFITYSYNSSLDKSTNKIIESVFKLIVEKSNTP